MFVSYFCCSLLPVIVFKSLVSCDCYCSVGFPHCAIGGSEVCDYGISGHNHLFFSSKLQFHCNSRGSVLITICNQISLHFRQCTSFKSPKFAVTSHIYKDRYHAEH